MTDSARSLNGTQGSGCISVLLANSHRLVRELVVNGLELEPGICVIGTAATADEALAMAARIAPDVVILSVGLAGADPTQTACKLRSTSSASRVLVLAEDEDQSVLTGNIRCGANGYITTGCSMAELAAAVRAVHEGTMHVPTPMLGPLISTLIGDSREQREARRRLSRLTQREREALALLVKGASTDGIAAALVISPDTARSHVQHVLSKLGVHSRLEAAAYVVERGVVEELPEVPDVPARRARAHA